MAIGDKLVNLDALKAVHDADKVEITDLKSAINDIYIGKPISVAETNKLNPDDVVQGTNITPNGTESPYDNYDATGFIPLDTTKTSIAFTGNNSNGTARVCLTVIRLLFYNSDKTTVTSYVDNIASNTITPIPSGAAFARIVVNKTFMCERYPMVEFVDAIGEISSVYIAYQEVEEHSHGLEYLDETQQEILSRLSVAEDELEQLDGVPEQVAENTNDISDIFGDSHVISELATFEHGNVNSSTGAYNGNNYDYRIATPDIIAVNNNYSVTIADGFRLYLFVFNEQGGKLSGAWYTGTAQLSSGSKIRMIIARTTENQSETADIAVFCSQVTYKYASGLNSLQEQILSNKTIIDNTNAVIHYGLTWDWWISANSIDAYGNVYIGYVDTDQYAGVLRRQPDGTMQYKRLERSYNDDDHNGMATIVLDDGRILVIGSYGHAVNNHIICYRSVEPYSIDQMERLSFDIPQTGEYLYRTTYSQIFKYNGVLFDFLRCGSQKNGVGTTTGYACLVSNDNGSTWTAYKAVCGAENVGDPYIAFSYTSDDDKILKAVLGHNPSTGTNPDMLKGFTFDMSTLKFHDLAGVEIGQMVALNGESIFDNAIAHEADMTSIIQQGSATNRGRLFTVAKTPKSKTIFLYAIAESAAMTDFAYYLYNDGTSVEIGHSGVPFGNNHYLSGICFGKDENIIYYSTATTSAGDGPHELHKVTLLNGALEQDAIIAESSICLIRPLFLGSGEIAVLIGHYNDQNNDGTYNSSFTAWELKPLFVN